MIKEKIKKKREKNKIKFSFPYSFYFPSIKAIREAVEIISMSIIPFMQNTHKAITREKRNTNHRLINTTICNYFSIIL